MQTRSNDPRARIAAEFRRQLRQMAYLPLAWMLAFAVVLSWAASSLLERAALVDHTHVVIGQAHRCLLIGVDLQTGLRGFQITGDPAFLEPYHAARADANEQWLTLERLVADNLPQQERVRLMRRQLGEYLEFSERVIQRRRAGGDVFDRALNDESKRRFDELRRHVREFVAEEERLLADRSSLLEKVGRSVLTFRFVGAIVFAGLLSLLVRRSIRRLGSTYENALNDVEKSAETLAVTLRSIGDGVITTDLEGRVRFLNPAAETMLGWRSDDAVGRPVQEVFPIVSEETGERVENPVTKVLRDGQVVDRANHTALVRRDGSRRSVADSGAPIRGRDGTTLGVVLVFRDVTDERLVARERDRLAHLVERSTDFIGTADLQGRLTYLNRAGRKLIGLSDNEDIHSISFRDYLPAEGQAFFNDTVLRATRERGHWEGEMQLQHLRTGERLDVWRSTFLLRNPDTDEPTGFATVTRDITDRKRDERALHESAERHRLALEATGLGTWHWDIRTGELLWDERCRTIFGFPAGAPVTYEAFVNRVAPADRSRVDAAVQAALHSANGGSYDAEFEVRIPDAPPRWVRSKGQAFFAANNGEKAAVMMTGAALDITEQKSRQAELELRVAERTRELTAANERLQELDRLKSEFLASMSHELRTPLNSIIGFTEIVVAGLAGPLNDEQSKQLQMSLNSSRHLLSLINDLLDLARIESGRAAPHCDWLDLRDVLRHVENTLAPLVARKAITLRVEAPPALRMFSDQKMVYQILLNLAGNAVKFTERGEVAITCFDEGDRVRVVVTDTGIGIKAENMKLLFEAFRQVDGSARRKFEGTGLGLHLSKRLTGLLTGAIEAQSDFGRGSRFTVTLPTNRHETTRQP